MEQENEYTTKLAESEIQLLILSLNHMQIQMHEAGFSTKEVNELKLKLNDLWASIAEGRVK